MVTPKQFAVIDFETTGFGHTDRVIEVGVVLLNHNHEVERTWETLIQPNRDISNSFVHHITAGDVADAPTFEQVSGELAGLLNGRTIVAHNAPFEVRFLRREFGRLGLHWPTYGAWIVDTMLLVKQRFPGESSTLTHALDLLKITNARPHSALADAQATADLFTRLTEDSSELLMSSATLALPPFTYPPARGILARNSSAAPQVSRNQWLASLSAGIPNKGTGDVEQYKKILTAALADRELSRTEIHQLEQQAERDGLGRDDLLSIHEEFIRQLAIEAWLDGVITEEERATVTTLNEQLGLPAELADELLAEPQEGESQLGLSLNVGDRVTFTGQLDLPRDEWEKRAEAVGLNVGGVTKKSALLIAADPDSMSGKAKKAREYGVPVVGEKTFAQLVHNMTGDVVAVEENLSHAEPVTEPTDFASIFPWSERTAEAEQSSRELAVEWCTKFPHRPLVEVSPQLTGTTPIEVHSGFKTGYEQWFARHSQPLMATVEDLNDLRGVGVHKLITMVEAVVIAAIDSHISSQAADVEPLDAFYEDEHHDGDLEEFTGDTESDGSHNAPGVNWSDITLYAGWLKLTNVGADHRLIPDAVLEEMPALAGHLGAVDPVKELFDRAAHEVRVAAEGDPRKLTIVKKRLVGGVSLEEVGAEFEVTRERVRQLERDWKNQFEANSGLFNAVVDAIHQRVAPLARVGVVRQDLPALVSEVDGLECTYSDLFVALGKKWKVVDGWAVEPGFKNRVRHALEELSDDYGVVALAEVAAALGVSAELLEEYIVTSDKLKVVIVDDKVLTRVGNYQDRAVSVLAINGEPMTAEAIMEVMGGGNHRSASNQFSIDPRLVKISADQWGLADWGLEEFKSIASWIGQCIRQGGRKHVPLGIDGEGTEGQPVQAVPLADLLADAERLRIAESSIRLYASIGEYETRDGMVFERIDDSGNAVEGDIEDTRDVYLRDDSWHLLVTVTKDHLRGSGFQVPLGVAAYYGVKVGEEVALKSRLGDQFVRVNRIKQASISTMKRFLDDMGIREGQRVWLKLGEDKTFDVLRAEDDAPGQEGVQWLYNLMGLDPKLVTVGESIEDSLVRVNISLGLNPMAPRRRTVARFRHRRQDDIADRVRGL